jgi:hypothetical protein
MEEMPTGEEVLVGTFFLNGCPIVILFDSGASHDIMSSICAKEAKLSLVASRMSYVISTPGGRVDTDRLVQRAPLDLAGRVYETDLIVLNGQGIDVILRMRWMKWNKATLDISARLVHLNSPVYGKVTLHLPTVSHIKASLHHMVELQIEDIYVVREFLDVFPDDLPGMLIERVIELQLGTAPIARYLCLKVPATFGAITMCGSQNEARNNERGFAPGHKNVHFLREGTDHHEPQQPSSK